MDLLSEVCLHFAAFRLFGGDHMTSGTAISIATAAISVTTAAVSAATAPVVRADPRSVQAYIYVMFRQQ